MLEVRKLNKRFGKMPAVDEVSLTISSGELFVLLGPSGCGKTTLLRLIGGLEQADQGEILLDGVRIDTLPTHLRSVHTVFQNYALFPHLNVFDNVAFGPRVQKLDKKEVDSRVCSALELVRMNEFSNRKPETLSGGQKQRVALARALINRPKVLLLDEPLSALDQRLRIDMQTELVSLQRELGITFVFVTHDQNEAMGMSDRICIMNSGKIQQIGKAEEIYRNPANGFVAEFFGHSNTISCEIDMAGDLSFEGNSLTCTNLIQTQAQASSLRRGTLLARPEDIRLVPLARLDSSHGLRVEITKILFKGPATELVCHFGQTQSRPLIIQLPSTETAELCEGQEYFVHFQKAWLLP